ncbi:MAG: 3-deoxy-7-phosphoheptulonate synthase [Pseudomonadota bacterium]
MKYQTDDLRITGMAEVIGPEELIADLPVGPDASRLIFDTRHQAAEIVHGTDDRILAIVGPCSIHDTGAALEYASRLKGLADELSEDLLIVMRVYFEKPRTIVGWKGLINDPHLDDSFDINLGLHMARGLLRDIADLGLSAGTEYLDPITPQYVADLVSWGAIGARTTESQVHRQLASGLSCPIGFKNSTDGSIQVAVDAIRSAGHPHIFLSVTKQGRSAIFSTGGNRDCHVILRGGNGKPNYSAEHVNAAVEMLEQVAMEPRLMIDMSHANSEKKHERQLDVGADICRQLESGSDHIMGVMIESNLVAGRQDIAPKAELTYGQSITDACISWESTEPLLRDLAAAVAKRRQVRAAGH